MTEEPGSLSDCAERFYRGNMLGERAYLELSGLVRLRYTEFGDAGHLTFWKPRLTTSENPCIAALVSMNGYGGDTDALSAEVGMVKRWSQVAQDVGEQSIEDVANIMAYMDSLTKAVEGFNYAWDSYSLVSDSDSCAGTLGGPAGCCLYHDVLRHLLSRCDEIMDLLKMTEYRYQYHNQLKAGRGSWAWTNTDTGLLYPGLLGEHTVCDSLVSDKDGPRASALCSNLFTTARELRIMRGRADTSFRFGCVYYLTSVRHMLHTHTEWAEISWLNDRAQTYGKLIYGVGSLSQ